MRNSDVIRRFTLEREARAGNLTTDGKTIRSYSLVIGFNLGEQSYVIDYTGYFKFTSGFSRIYSYRYF